MNSSGSADLFKNFQLGVRLLTGYNPRGVKLDKEGEKSQSSTLHVPNKEAGGGDSSNDTLAVNM